MNRDEFRAAIFSIVEQLTRYQLSDTGKKLVLHYFNESNQPTAYRRAVEAVERYTHESMPESESWPPRLRTLMKEMAVEAEQWDCEQ